MGDLDSATIKKTQNVLGKYVKKPALTEKLLKKPPFRFLHDVINVVIKDTGFLSGLYSSEELISDNIKDRDAKIAYLQKLIDVTKSVTGQELKVRPSKVVAGLEPDKTNELLQAIGYALDKKLDSSSAVQAYIKGKVDDTPAVGTESTVANGVKKDDTHNDKKKGSEKDKEKVKERDKTNAKNKNKDKVKVKDKERTSRSRDTEAKKEDIQSKKDKPEKSSKIKEKEKTTVAKQPVKSKTSKLDTKSTIDTKKLEKQRSKDKEKPLKRSDSVKEEPHPKDARQSLNNIAESSIENENNNSPGENQEAIDIHGKKTPPTTEDDLIAVIDEEDELKRSSSRRSSLKKQGSLTASENNALADLNQYNGLEIQGPSRQNSGIMGEPVINRHDSDPVEPIASERISAKPPMNRQQSVDSVMRPRTSLRPPSVRPPSARPGAPRRKEKNVEIVLQPNETTKLGEINVKMEVFNNELLDDDGENLVVIEDPTQIGDVYSGKQGEFSTDTNKEEQEQGHLVQQILETQKEFSNITGPEAIVEVQKKLDNEWTTSQRQSSVKQMEMLRESIQKLTRSVNPLGKLMDFIQEDIDAMERELTNWQQIYSRALIDLNRERSVNENAIEPLKHQLAQIETNIKEYRDMVDVTRGNILQNEQKIERLYMTEI